MSIGRVSSTVALTGSDQVVLATPGYFAGITLRETVGSTASVKVYDNASAASGPILASVQLAANAYADIDRSLAVRCVNGIYVDIVSGTVEGSIRVA